MENIPKKFSKNEKFVGTGFFFLLMNIRPVRDALSSFTSFFPTLVSMKGFRSCIFFRIVRIRIVRICSRFSIEREYPLRIGNVPPFLSSLLLLIIRIRPCATTRHSRCKWGTTMRHSFEASSLARCCENKCTHIQMQ